MAFDPTEHSHRRFNPMKGDWVLVCPHRCKRPWLGQKEDATEEERPEFDPKNGLCPGVTRSSGLKNPEYKSTYVFPNDFPALLEEVPAPENPSVDSDSLFQIERAAGACKVMCFSPKSNITLPQMGLDELVEVVETWLSEFKEMAAKYRWVQIFENKGAIMGCSNPHPHCQIWSSSFMPNEAHVKDKNFRSYYERKGSPMLVDYARQELEKGERLVCSNEDWLAIVPYWAMWPYECMIIPKKDHILRMSDLTQSQVKSLAAIMKSLTTRYDNLFGCSFPYSMGFHGAPTGPGFESEDNKHWQFHALYFPPLLRSATVKKFMVGYEMLANAQRDLTPEQAATALRNQTEVHYKLSRKKD